MKRLVLGLFISIGATLSCLAKTDLLSVNVWDREDAATASGNAAAFAEASAWQGGHGSPQLSLAAETLGTPSQVSPLDDG